MIKDNNTYLGRIKLEVIRNGKTIFATDWIKNIETNVGKAATAGLVGNTGAISPFIYLAVGTSATAVSAADTALGAEISTNGLSRAAATVSRVTTTVTNDTLQLVNVYTSSGTFSVQEAGIFNAASVGILLAHALTGTVSISSGDQLSVTYQIKYA